MKKTLLQLCLFLVLSNLILGQTKNATSPTTTIDTVHYTYDTLKTLCQYMNNLATGESPTSYLTRVRKYRMDFVQPTPDEFKKDSFIIKKQKVIVDIIYYMPMWLNDPVKKGEKPKRHIQNIRIPKELIIKDWEGNLDYILQQLEQQNKSTDSLNKIPVVKNKK